MNSPKNEFSESPAPSPARKARADGIESRRAILTTAARLATTRGLEGLSIGDLAAHIGMSKSGLYAHFKSKEELELATIETAAQIFEDDVIHKVPAEPRGLARIEVLTEAFLQHLIRRTFPGGCFFATVAAQLAAHPGRARDRITQLQIVWAGQFMTALNQARDDGELPRDAELDQLLFEIMAMMFRANFDWIVTEDERALDRARIGVRNVLARVTTKTPSHKQHRRAKDD
jgi:AcrR family transcriptional regulator